jgi:hypothetical protein
MAENKPDIDAPLEGLDETKRETVRRLVLKGFFVAPIVVSFSMAGLTVEAAAASGNTTVSFPSDRRLKKEVTRVATHPAGFGIYRFKYFWSDVEHTGVLAQEVLDIVPAAVSRGDDGFLRVNYAAIGMRMDAPIPV